MKAVVELIPNMYILTGISLHIYWFFKKIEELNHIVKLSNQEKQTVLTKARDSFKADIQKLKTELNNVNMT